MLAERFLARPPAWAVGLPPRCAPPKSPQRSRSWWRRASSRPPPPRRCCARRRGELLSIRGELRALLYFGVLAAGRRRLAAGEGEPRTHRSGDDRRRDRSAAAACLGWTLRARAAVVLAARRVDRLDVRLPAAPRHPPARRRPRLHRGEVHAARRRLELPPARHEPGDRRARGALRFAAPPGRSRSRPSPPGAASRRLGGAALAGLGPLRKSRCAGT